VPRIAFVIPTLDQSGAERQLTLLAEGLVQAGCDVHVVALVRGGYFEEQLHSAGATVHILRKSFRFDPLIWMRLRRCLRQIQPDVVQSFLFSANTLVRLPGVTPAGCRIVVSERCVDSWKSRWQLFLDRRLAGRADAMTANSESVRSFYVESGVPQEKVHLIRNGIPVAPAERDQQWIRDSLGLRPELRLIGYVGRLAEQKRVMDLIWSFQLLHQLLDNVHLVIVGDGPQRQYLEQFSRNMGCDDKITFTGHRDDAYRLMQGLDVFCLASSFEGMSNSLMEAMSYGLPVVASAIPANLELVDDGVDGLTFEVTRAADLTKCIRRVLEDTGLAEQLGNAAAARMRNSYGVDRLVREHVALYERLTADRLPPVPAPGKD